jgi:hypothetical protein
MRTHILFAMAIFSLLSADQAAAATVTFGTPAYRYVTPAEVADGAPIGAVVSEYFVTTDVDILRVGNIIIDTRSSLYQYPAGSDAEPPHPLFVSVFPALGADSWITTPGAATAITGGGFARDNAHWFDTTNDGPVTNFMFARLTMRQAGNLRGEVSVAGAEGPQIFQFHIPFLGPEPYPEPGSLALSGIGLLGLTALRRRTGRLGG